MTVSVRTNESALVALQNLNQTKSELERTQNRIATGLEVAESQDNAAVYAVAQTLRADINAYDAVNLSLARAQSIGEVALAAGETISDLLIDMRAKATAAVDASLDASSRAAYNTDFQGLLEQLQSAVQAAVFDGSNLLDGSATPGVAFLADADATRTVTLGSQNLTLGGPNITVTAASNLSTLTNAQAALTALDASLLNVGDVLATLGADLNKIDAQANFVGELRNTLEVGVGNLVDADLGVESARLQALQVRQQLGVEALSIANSDPQAILSLFRSAS